MAQSHANRRFAVVLSIAALTAGSALAGAYSGQIVTDWVSYNGSYDGDFLDENHWQSSKGFPSNYTFRANFVKPSNNSGYTVTFTGAVTNSAPARFIYGNATTTTVYGVGASWLMPSGETDIYPGDPLHFGNASYPFLSLGVGNYSQPPMCLSDFLLRMESDATAKNLAVVCERGTYNFYDPEGTPRSSATSLILSLKDNLALQSASLKFRPGALLSAGTVVLQPNNYTNLIEFTGGSHSIASGLYLSGGSGDKSLARNTLSVVRLSEGASLTVGTLNVGLSGATAQKRYGIELDASTLSMSGFSFTSAAEFFLTVRNGSTVNLTDGTWQFSRGSGCNTTISAADSTIRFGAGGSLGQITASSGDCTAVFAATNCYINQGVKNAFAVNGRATVEFVDCVWTNGCNVNYGNVVASGKKPVVVLKGSNARSHFKEDFIMSAAATESEFVISGGVHRVDSPVFKIGASASGGTAVFTIAGGTTTVSKMSSTYANCRFAFGAGSTATLNLLGGTLAAPALLVGSGTANLVADGGTFSAQSGGTAVSGFATATIGGGGFVVDTAGRAVTIDQDFSGTGPLVLTGGGSVTLAAGRSVAGGVIVRGGTTLVFAGAATLGGLVLGDDGTVCPVTLPYGQTLSVGGDIEASAFSVAFTGGAYSKADGEVEIFRASGSLRGDTGAKWLDAAMRSGVSAEGTAETTVGQDGRSLLLEVRDSVTIEISVGAGESVVTNGVIRALSGDTLVVDVGEGGAFTATASVGSGAKLVKRGEGDLVLESAANRFSSVTNEAGMIVLRHPDALGGATVVASGDGIVYDFAEPAATESTFVVAKAQSNEAVRVEVANADAAVPLYDILNGGVVKDGPGAASFMMPDQNIRLSATAATPWKGSKNGDAGFTIRQGEVAFRGRTPTIRELTYSYMGLKLGVADPLGTAAPVAPTLVFDHIAFEASAAPLHFARNGASPSAGDVSVIVTNHAAVTMNALLSGRNVATSSDARSHLFVDDSSSLRFDYGMRLEPDGGELEVVVDNCSTVLVGYTSLRGNVDMTFRNRSCMKGISSPTFSMGYGVARHATSFRFESGSELLARFVGETEQDKTSPESICRLVFAGGAWNPVAADFTFSFVRISGSLLVEGEGLVLAPQAGQTWTLGVPVEDIEGSSGGLVKRGAGTVVLNAANKSYTGTTRLEGGTLDLDGTTIRDMRLAGSGGMVANGTLVSPIVDVALAGDIGLPAFNASSVSMTGTGKIDFGRGEGNPIEKDVAYPFATYTGAAPTIAWRAQNTGLSRVRTVVVAADGVLYVKLVQSGMMFIFR